MRQLVWLSVFIGGLCCATKFLTIDKSSKTFKYDGKTVFLSGANQAWNQYANDFGNHQANGVFCELNRTLTNISTNGGNSVREWLFIDGSNIPGTFLISALSPRPNWFIPPTLSAQNSIPTERS